MPPRLILATVCAAIASALAPSAARAESIWIESESLAQKPAAASTGWAKPEWLSGRQLLALNFDSRAVADAIPEAGVILSYPVSVKTPGTYTLWNRVVFENNRAPFEWRVGSGPWTLNSQKDQPITNVQELAFWNPVGWTRLGTAQLAAGDHTLEIRLTRQLRDPADASKGFAELRYVSDCIHLTTTEFRPNYAHRPGDAFQSDADRAAAAHRFVLAASPEPRRSVALSGLWQFAPYDEIGEIAESTRVAGADTYPDLTGLPWYGLTLPADRNTALPATRYTHRFLLRTRVEVPATPRPAGYHLEFTCLNLITTLFVNGRKIGDFDVALGRWQVDVTSAIKPGATNEILLVVKDTFYAIAPDGNIDVRRYQYLPDSLFHGSQGTTMRMDYPIANGHGQSGILDTATLVATEAPVYVADTFVKPFPITKKSIEFDATLRNATAAPAEATVRLSVRTWPEGKPVATVGEKRLTVPAGATATATLDTPSAPIPLWWIFQPALHELVTEVVVGGQVVDRHNTRFGNREWEIRGNQFFLNGVQQHLRADLTHNGVNPPRPRAEIVADWQRTGMNMWRGRFQFPWNGLTAPGTLAWMDEVGMPVRMNPGTFDGQLASYGLVEGPSGQRTARRALFDRWQAQLLNNLEHFKNHPSVFIWELDNEIVYINGRNFGHLGQVEPEFTATSNALLARDPTRSTVSGGGRALRDDSLPTYGVHYFEVPDRHYPDEAYTGDIALKMEGTGQDARVWPVHFDKKPIFFSETAFLPGRNPAGFAAVGGEITFLGKREARPAAGRIAQWLAEGYRWKGYAATHFWFGDEFTDHAHFPAWQPVAILRREWNDTFAPGQVVTRDFRVYNDLPDTRPITAAWSLELGGKVVASGQATHSVPPGGFTPWPVTFTLPASAAARTEGRLVLNATRAGESVFTRSLPITLLPDPKPSAAKLSGGDLVVWDPSGEALARLRAAGYSPVREVKSLAEIPERFGLLVVGRNALAPADATHRRWQALAASGNKILLLEQKHPLHFQATPADVEPTTHDGRIAFSQNLEHPAFRGLAQADLEFWGADHVVYRGALRKPTRGGTSLAHCDTELGYTALLETPVNEGLLLTSQFALGEKLGTEVVARRLFDNLVAYAAGYRKVTRPLQTLVQDPVTRNALAAIGVPSSATTDPLAALRAHPGGLVVVQGTPENLTPLAAAPKELAAFWEAGGYLVVLNVTPESLAAFNRIVGYEHILRPLREELVRLPAVPHPLTAGLTLRDVVMSSGKRIQTFNQDEWPNSDAFDHVVDLDDIAPFSTFPSPAHFGRADIKGPGDDRWPLNMVNGYGADTHWRMTFSITVGGPGAVAPKWDLELPREETITGFSLAPNRTYHAITKLRLTFDGDPATAQDFTLDSSERVDLAVTPRSARKLGIELLEWNRQGTQDVIGVDNLWVTVRRPADFAERVRPMLNIGGLVEYPRGQGGVVLSQYVFRTTETNPVNADKKKTLLSVVLRNLGADLGGEKVAVAGFNLGYGPLSLEAFGNLYLTSAQGWSAPGGDLSAFPRGANTFAGVRYLVRDFTTSPLESGVTLKHPQLKSNAAAEQITGIPVGTVADSLFFLHTFLQTREWRPSRQQPDGPPLFTYTVNYEDGTSVPVVIFLNEGVGAWLQPANAARSLPRAELAWTGPAVSGGRLPVVYQFQWNNPTPAKKIISVDLAYAENGRDFGTPVLLALTAARVQQ